MRILLVEDNADHRELMSLALTGHDPTWQVEGVVSGEEALRRLGEEAYDLVFLDYSLPGRDGLEVLKEIRRGEAPPPVVMVTGRGDEQVAVEAMKGGAYDYVTKVEGYLQRLPVVAQRAVEAYWLAAERKQVEEALREAEKRYRDLYDNAPVMYHTIDTKGIVLECNQTEADMLGYSKEEIIGQPIYAFETKEYQDLAPHALREGMEKGHAVGERRLVRKDGTIIDAALDATAIYDDSGQVVGFRSTFTDITERKRVEEKRRDALAELTTIYQNVPIAMLLVDRDRRVRKVNGAAAQLAGRPAEEMLGLYGGEALRCLHHLDDPQGCGFGPACAICPVRLAVLDTFADRQSRRGVEAWLPFPRGGSAEERCLLVSTAYLRIADSERVLVCVQDITEHRRAEEESKRRNEELAALNAIAAVLSQSLDLEEVLDAALGETRAVLNVEGGLIYLFDETSQTFAPAIHHGISQDVLREVTGFKMGEGLSGHVAKSGKPLVTALGKNARDISPSAVREEWRSYAGVPIKSKGKVLGVMTLVSRREDYFKPDHLGLLSHIGNQIGVAVENARLYEAEHAARQQLRDLASYLQAAREEERTHIAREIHDEFGQMLSALNMDLSWLSKRLPADQPHLAEKASAMSDLIESTIQTVRRVATELRPGLLDELGLAATMEWQAQEFAERTGISCDLYLSDEEIVLDRDLATAIFRIFQETLTNVARHAQATEVHVELEDRPGELVLVVRDNGKGITESQVSHPRSLGLMGMRERARSWGGEVAFQGVAGQGTTVTVRIPNAEFGMRNSESSR